MTTTETDPSLEDRLRHEYGVTCQMLVELRNRRKEIDTAVRALVAEEKTQKRLIAVFDRAKAKQSS